MQIYKDYLDRQLTWLNKITKDIETTDEVLSYEQDEITVSAHQMKSKNSLTIKFKRTVNTGKATYTEQFSKQQAFKTVTFLLKTESFTLYDVLKFINGEWRQSKMSEKWYKRYVNHLNYDDPKLEKQKELEKQLTSATEDLDYVLTSKDIKTSPFEQAYYTY